MWRELENGPFPITREQLDEARHRYAAEWAEAGPFSGPRVAPQTTARAILREVAPHLTDFDAMMLGFAVSNNQIRVLDAEADVRMMPEPDDSKIPGVKRIVGTITGVWSPAPRKKR